MEATDQEIESYRERLNNLTAKCSGKKQESQIKGELIELAREVGASTTTNVSQITKANTSELIQNIHQALQTASMVNMCKSARVGYEIATEASKQAVKASRSATKQFWIAVAIAIAFFSAVAAWVAAMRT